MIQHLKNIVSYNNVILHNDEGLNGSVVMAKHFLLIIQGWLKCTIIKATIFCLIATLRTQVFQNCISAIENSVDSDQLASYEAS